MPDEKKSFISHTKNALRNIHVNWMTVHYGEIKWFRVVCSYRKGTTLIFKHKFLFKKSQVCNGSKNLYISKFQCIDPALTIVIPRSSPYGTTRASNQLTSSKASLIQHQHANATPKINPWNFSDKMLLASAQRCSQSYHDNVKWQAYNIITLHACVWNMCDYCLSSVETGQHKIHW